MPPSTSRALLLPVAALALMAPLGAADGTQLIGIGPAQLGAAGAGVASPQDSTWIELNPAALVELPQRVDAAVELIDAKATLTPQGPLGNSAAGTMSDRVLVEAPDLTYSGQWGGGALGFGVYSVSGLAIEYPAGRSSALVNGTGFDRRAQAETARASLVYSRTLIEQWSLGIALDGDYQQFRSDALTGAGTETSGAYRLDHALGAGFAVAVYRHWAEASFGLCYTSRQWMQRLRDYGDLLESSVDQPQEVQAGVAWRPLAWLEPMLDYRYIDWTSVKVFGDHANGFGWRNQNIVMLGANAYAAEGLVLRAGVAYGRSPITDSEAFTNGLTPLITEWHAALGASYVYDRHLSLQASYVHGFKKTLVDDGSDAGGLGKGTRIALTVDSLALGLGYLF
jgi:long-chain fatty acid transport protein